MMPGRAALRRRPRTGSRRVDQGAGRLGRKGVAPERVIASKNEGGKAVRTRPLCAYPLRAVYSGSGSIDEEKSFTCSK